MDTRTRSASPISPGALITKQDLPPVQDKISAYYSLVFPHFTFYIQTLSITIGRRCAPNSSVATSSTAEAHQVDVDLGALKSVSRLHAKIEYDQDEDRFVLAVIGRNGAWVDGIWSGSGARAPLGERSQIQIASRTFHFILPPPPPPEDTPSPSSQSSSANRPRSPSVDITSISPPSSQPSHSPPPVKTKPPLPSPESQRLPLRLPPPLSLPNSNTIGKSNKASNSKKRKKGDVDPPVILERPKPEDMPPKPPFTYAQLIYRAIKALGGKATLQEICNWIMNTYDYYKYADGAWMSSVRHNLSSGRAFLKMERCGGDRGKGFFWSVDEKHSQLLEEQEAKSQQVTVAASRGGTGKDTATVKGARKKDKGTSPLEPPLKRSVRGDHTGAPLPPPLTSIPLAMKTTAASLSTTTTPPTSSTPATTGVFAYPSLPHQAPMVSSQSSVITSSYSGTPLSAPNPYAVLTQSHWGMLPAIVANKTVGANSSHGTSGVTHSTISTSGSSVSPSQQSQLTLAQASVTQSVPVTQSASALVTLSNQAAVPDVFIPIVLGPIPPTHPDYAPNHPNNSVKEGYMVLHERKLILDPDIFSGVTKEMLDQLEKMGARAALSVLTGHMVRALKERRAKGRGKDRGVRRAKGVGGKGGAARKSAGPSASPFTNAPLDNGQPLSQRSNMGGNTEEDGANIETQQPADGTDFGGDLEPYAEPGTPIVNVDDSDDARPATKRRKLDDAGGLLTIS